MFRLFKNTTEIIWIATAILAVVKLYQTLECDLMEVQECLNRVDGLNFRGNVSGLAANKKDLEMACRAFFKGMQCIDEYVKICVTEEKRIRLEKDVMGPKKAMLNVCGADKPKFNDCYPILNKEIRNCSRSLYNVQRRRKYHSHDDMIKAHCCAQKKYVDCVHYKAKSLCDTKGSAEALKLAQTVSTNPEFEEQCRVYSLPFDCYNSFSIKLQISSFPSLFLPFLSLSYYLFRFNKAFF